MIGYKDIQKRIVELLREKFPNIGVTNGDVEEGFKRPSFFIELDNIRPKDYMGCFLERDLTVRIVYFSKDSKKNSIENLKMQDGLEELFVHNNLIELETDFFVEATNQDFNIVDKILHLSFDIYMFEEYEKTDSELIEDLEIGE